uniref:Myb-like domain-containing protein n=1 Tax=Panagrellus redivivus TaxID=6233 RepID=A0A7E4V9G3_PANRE
MAESVPKDPSHMPEVNHEPPPKSTSIADSASQPISSTSKMTPPPKDHAPTTESSIRRQSTSPTCGDSPKIGRKRSKSEASTKARGESSVTAPMASSVAPTLPAPEPDGTEVAPAEPEKRPKLILHLPFAWRKRPSAPAALEITSTPLETPADESSNPVPSNTASLGNDPSFKTPLAQQDLPKLASGCSLPNTPAFMNASLFNFPELFAYSTPVVPLNPTPVPTPVSPQSPAKISPFSATNDTPLTSAVSSTPVDPKPIPSIPTATHHEPTSLAEHVFTRPKRNKSKSVADLAPSLMPRVLQKRASIAALVSNDAPANDYQPPPAPSPLYHPSASDVSASHKFNDGNNNSSGHMHAPDPPEAIQPPSSKAPKRKQPKKSKEAAAKTSDDTLDTPASNVDRIIIDFGDDAIEHLKLLHKDIAKSLYEFEKIYDDNFFIREILTTFVITYDADEEDDEDDILDVGLPGTSQPPRSLNTPSPEYNRVSRALVRQLIQLLPEVKRKTLVQAHKVATAMEEEFELRGKALLNLVPLISDQYLMEIAISGRPDAMALFHTHTLQNATRFRNAIFVDFSKEFMDAHAWLLLNLEEHQLQTYLTLLKYLKPAGTKLSGMFVQKAPESIAVTNEIVEKIIVEKTCDPYIRMLTQIKRKLKQPNVYVVLVYPGITFDDENISPIYHTHEPIYLALSNMGAVVEKLAIHNPFPEDTNPNMNQAADYAVEFVRNKLKEIVKRRPGDRIFVAAWGVSCLFVHDIILDVSGISGLIDLAIPMFSPYGSRGIAGDKMLLTYCPTLLVIGEMAENSVYADVVDILENFTGQAGLIAVGGADDNLIVDVNTLAEYGITQACISRLIIHHIMDFIDMVVENTENETHTKKLTLKNPFNTTIDIAAHVTRPLDDVDPVEAFEEAD